MVSKNMWIGIIVIIIVVIGIFVFSGFINIGGRGEGIYVVDPENVPTWMEFELIDIRTGETFTIFDLTGKPILLESFAVWCPTCTKQQNIVKELHEEPGFSEEELISISINTDPSEDENRIRAHVNANGFTWYYAVSPIEMTQSLINEFGNSIISAPSVPMILICEDLSYRKLGGFGARSVDKLKSEIAKGC